MIRMFVKFVNLFGIKYKLAILALFLSSIVSGFLEIMGVALIVPFMAIIKDPSMIERSHILHGIYDFLGFTDTRHMIYFITFCMGGVFVFKNVYTILHNYVEFGFIMRWKNYTTKILMEKYLRMPFLFHLKRSSTSLIGTLNHEVSFAFENFLLQFVLMISNLLICAILIGFILYLFFMPALIAGLILAGLMCLQIYLVRKTSNRVNSEYMMSRTLNLSTLQKSIFAIKETKTFLKEKTFVQEYDRTNQIVSRNDQMFMFMRHFPPNVTEIVLITAVLTMSCLILASSSSTHTNLTHLAILAVVAFRIAPTINRFLYCYSCIKSSQKAIKHVYEEMTENTEELEDVANTKKISFKKTINLKDVGFSYDADLKSSALRNINLDIKKGEFIGVIGASGAGKTTLIDILMGLLIPQKGNLVIDGVNITKKNVRSYRANIGYVSQAPFLSPDTVKKNIAYGVDEKDISKKKVIEVLKKVQLYDFFMAKKLGLDTPLGENAKNISGGQKQRIAIARALYNDPAIIVLDEATSALDVETEQEISQSINDLKGKKTIIAIAHRLSTLKKCDRIVYMDKGEIFDIGTFKELYSRHPKFKKIIELSNISNYEEDET